jgi:hypothetical protein
MLQVTILDFPVRLGLRARLHRESLLREFAIIASQGGEAADVPKRLVEISRLSDERYMASNQEADDVIDAAAARGDEYVRIALDVPERLPDDTNDTVSVLLEAYDYCHSGEMLTLAPPPDIGLFWVWLLGELMRQSHGMAPMSWINFSGRYGVDASS